MMVDVGGGDHVRGKEVTYHYDYLQLSFLLADHTSYKTLSHILKDDQVDCGKCRSGKRRVAGREGWGWMEGR